MNEVYNIKGEKKRVNSLEEAHALVVLQYPNAQKQGSVAHWAWRMNWEDDLSFPLAELWPSRNGQFWWLRIKK